MVSVHKITGIWIEEIEKVEVTEPEETGKPMNAKRTLAIWTTSGEKVELILEAASAERLEFKDAEGWLFPKVYKGRNEDESSSNL